MLHSAAARKRWVHTSQKPEFLRDCRKTIRKPTEVTTRIRESNRTVSALRMYKNLL